MASISQKILSRAASLPKAAEPGEIVEAQVDYAMSHDGTSVLAIKSWREMGSVRGLGCKQNSHTLRPQCARQH